MSEKLNIKQLAAVRSLLSSPDVRAAAAAAGCAERTIYRWLTEAPFQAALDAAQDQALDAASRGLVALTSQAIEVLSDVLTSPLAKSSSKLRAAEIVLSNALRLTETRDLLRRISALEGGDSEG